MRLMRWGIAAQLGVATLAAIGQLACADMSLLVAVQIPADYRELVDAVELSVLLPPAAEEESFGCDAVAFDEVSAAVFELNLLQRHVLSQDGSVVDLAAIPRSPTKLLVVRGLAADQTLVVAGCSEVGTIDGALDVTVRAEPASVMTAPSHDFDVPWGTENLSYQLRDVLGTPLGQWPVRSTELAAGGVAESRDLMTDGAGQLVIGPAEPTLPGPMALDVRPQWPHAHTPTLLAYQGRKSIGMASLGAPEQGLRRSVRVGRLGPAGSPAVAVLDASSVLKMVSLQGGKMVSTEVSSLAKEVPLPQAVGLRRGDKADQLILTFANEWHVVQGIELSKLPNQTGSAPDALALHVVPACNSTIAERFVVQVDEPPSVRTYDTVGSMTGEPIPLRKTDKGLSLEVLADAGCISTVSGERHPAMLITPKDGQSARLVIEAEVRHSVEVGAGWNLGLIPAQQDGPALLVGTTTTFKGVSVSVSMVALDGVGGAVLQSVESLPMLGTYPVFTAAGDVDGDDQRDFVTLGLSPEQLGDGASWPVRRAEHLGARIRGERLFGFSQDEPHGNALVLQLTDFDGDGLAETVVVTPDQVLLFMGGEAE